MKFLRALSLIMLGAGTALAQGGAPADRQAGAASVADEIKALREAVAQQQQQIAQQQLQIGQQQQKIDSLEKALGGTAHVENAALHPNAPATTATVSSDAPPQDKPKESPLSFRIGQADFTPGGFVDFETVFRTTNTGNNISTQFGQIPFSNTVQGHLTELRLTGQYSRYSLKVTTKFGANDVTGYLEGDFNGNDAANVFVTSNPHTNRLRLYWAQIKRGNWEFLGGQSWGWITPNRVGLSPVPADLAITINEDANIQVGIPYTRAGQFRVVYHPNDNWQLGAAVENPEQFVGVGEVIFPFAFNAQLGPQFDAGNNTATPNAFPDVISKIAYDRTFGNSKHFHFEAGGLLTTVKITNIHIGVPGTPFVTHTASGGSVLGAMNVDVVKGLRVLANGLWGQGNGRYLIGLGPAAVVRPIQSSPTVFDTELSLPHSGGGLAGLEFQPTKAPKTLFGAYYGAVYFMRNAFPDTTSPLAVKPIIGFGGINSPNSANRAIQEATFDWTQTMWRNPQYGAVVLITQTSYLTRSPWFVAPGAPKNAHLTMAFLSLRYVLP
ncbi:MAG TPA: hypothetical protein VKL40_05780 [Candidatus Angelobacter sp.]|nr:hypothetical protein [Candidatus Angelobacter sp.]